MKSKILHIVLFISLILGCCQQTMKGQNVIGAEITYQYLTLNTYEVILDVYADCAQSSLNSTQGITWRALSCSVSGNTAILNLESSFPIEVPLTCSDSITTCSGGGFIGANHYRYRGVVTVSTGCNDVVFMWDHFHRKGAINTLTNANTQGIHVEAMVDATTFIPNNSPKFIYNPLFFACTNQLIYYNPRAVDVDGDSLVYSLVDCQQSVGTSVNYAGIFNGGNPFSTVSPLVFDQETGAMKFRANTNLDAVVCIMVEEYRDGIKIGSIVRDFQLRMRNGCTNTLPTISGVNNTTNYQINTNVGSTLNFHVIANDLGNNNSINLTLTYDNVIVGATFAQVPDLATGPNAIRGYFNWTPGATDLGKQVFTLHLNDGNCSRLGEQTTTYVINVLPPTPVDAGPDTSVCLNDSVQLTAIGTGPGSITYQWSPAVGLSNPNIANPKASPTTTTTYSVTASYSNGTTATDQVIVTVNPVPLVVIDGYIDVTCNGGNDGSALAAASGGIGPYTYQWGATANNQIGDNAINLAAGTYCVTAADVNLCSAEVCVTIIEPPLLVASAAVDSDYNGADISCFGFFDGIAVANYSGGKVFTVPSYTWNNSMTTDVILELGAGQYTVTITDDNGCEAIDSVLLMDPPALTVNFTNITNVVCFGDSTGEIMAVANQGVMGSGYSYLWNNGQNTATATGLQVANNPYMVTVTDANGCTVSDNFNITQGAPLVTPSAVAVDSDVCFGDNIELLGTGNGAITYHWRGPSGFVSNLQTPIIYGATALNEGYYILSIEDNITGCFSAEDSIYVTVHSAITTPLLLGGGVICSGKVIRLEEGLGVASDSFVWIGPVQNDTTIISQLNIFPGDLNYRTGVWTLECINTTTGCSAISNPVFVNLEPTPPKPIPTSNGPICLGDTVWLSVPTVLTANANWYSNPGATFLVNSGNNIFVNGITSDTTFYLQYATPNFCRSDTASIFVEVHPGPVAPEVSPDIIVCEGDVINLYTTVSTADSFIWSHPTQTVPDKQTIIIDPSTLADAGQYDFYIIDDNGCRSLDTFVQVAVNLKPTAPIAQTNAPICNGKDLQLFHAGGCDESHWITPSGSIIVHSTDTLTFLSNDPAYGSGNWQLLCVDTLTGCIDSSNIVNVIVDPTPPILSTFNNGPVCIGDDVQLGVSLLGGASYQWYADSNLTIPIISGTGATPLVPNITTDSIFYVEVTLGGVCSSVGQTSVNTHAPATPFDITPSFSLCEGDTILLEALTPGDSYRWTLPSPGGNANGSFLMIEPANFSNSGLYTLSGRDTNGCVVPDTFVAVSVIANPSPPIISSNIICDGDSLVLVANGACDSIEWIGPSGIPFVGTDTLVVLPSDLANYVDGGDWIAICINTTTGCESELSFVHTVQINAIPSPPTISNNSSVCIGESVELSTPLVAGASYQWYNGDSTIFIGPGFIRNVPNITTDTTFLLSINVNGCTNSNITNLTVHVLPSTPNVPDTIEVCEFDSIFFFTDPQTSYNWSGPNGFNSIQQNPFIYPATSADSGLYSLIIKDANLCSSKDTSVLVIVNKLPASPNITIQNAAVCDGDTIFLYSNTSCDQLLWEGPSGVKFIGADSIAIDSLHPDYQDGDWTVFCIDTITGCENISNALTAIIKPNPIQPTLVSSGPICAGDSLNLSMSLTAGGFYQWFAADSNRIDTLPSITIYGLEHDTIFYGVVVVDGCSNFDNIPITVNPRPAIPNIDVVEDTLCARTSFIQFSINLPTPAGLIYNWTGPDGYNKIGTTPFVFPIDTNNTGTYYLNATDGNGCVSFDTSIYVHINPQPEQPSITGTRSVCDGDTIRLEGPICDSLIWYPSSLLPIGPISIVGNPYLDIAPSDSSYNNSTGSPFAWQVQCIDTTTGCASQLSSAADFDVTVYELPTNINPFNNGPICQYEGAVLSITQQPNPSTYIWSTDSLMTDTIGLGTTIFVDSIFIDSTFYVEVTSAFGCQKIGATTVNVTIPSGPTPLVVAVDSVICEGEDIVLGELLYTSGVSHEWVGPNGFSSTVQFPTITTATLLQSGWYTVFVRDANGCALSKDSINILVNALPNQPTVTGGGNICYGTPITLNSNGTCDSTVWISLADTILGTSNQLMLNIFDQGYSNATWTLLCYDTISGCSSISNNVAINIIPTPSMPIINNNNPICFGDSILFTTNLVLGATNVWYSDALLTDSIGSGDSLIIFNITSDSVVYLEQIVNGCTSPIASDTAFHLPTPPLPNVGPNITVCIGDSIHLTTSTPADAYLWTHPNGFNSTLQAPSLLADNFSNAGNYTLSLIDTNGCAAPSTFINVTVNSLPPMPIVIADDTVCQGDTMILGTGIIPPYVAISWIVPSGDTILGGPVFEILADSIHYQEGQWMAVFTDMTTGCASSVDTIITIDSIPTPGVIVNSGPVCIGDSVEITTTQIGGAVDYIWYRSDTSIYGFGANIIIPNIISDTFFGLVVETGAGCQYFMDTNFVFVHPPTPIAPIVVDTVNCEGDFITFGTDTAAGYTWVGPNGTISYQQNPTIGPVTTVDSGLYILNIEDTNGCASPDTMVNVQVHLLPSTPTGTSTTICAGDLLVLNSNAITCDAAYWIGPSGIVLEGANVTISPDSIQYIAGNWRVFCVDTITGCESNAGNITVVIRNAPVVNAMNNGPICLNDNVQLTANSIGGTNYLWFSDSLMTDTIGLTQVITVDSIVFDSTFYVIVIDTNGCSSTIASTTVNVQPIAAAPLIGSDVRICEGETINLTGPFALGYNWTGPNNYSSNQANPVIPNATIANTGTYTLSVIGPNGCASADTMLQVIVDSLPAAPVINGFTYLCEGDTLFLTIDSTGNHCDSMQWIGPNGVNLPMVGVSVAIPEGDTNYLSGLWQLQCIDTTTGCFSNSNFTLVVIAGTPDTQATFSNGPICIGGAVVLSTPTAATASANYTWYADSMLTNVSGTGQNPTIHGITTDTTFYLVITNGGGCNSAPIPTSVTVLPLGAPPNVPVDTQYCVGDSILLMTSTIANRYYWSANNGFVDSIQNPLVTATATVVDSGIYMLSVIDSNNCLSDIATFHIIVNELPLNPSIVSNSPLCNNDTLVLSSSGLCGQSQWIGPHGNNPTTLGTTPGGNNNLWTIGSSTSIPPTDSSYGNANWYMICMDTITGCQSISDTISVMVGAAPTISSISNTGPICSGDSLSLSVTALGSVGTTPTVAWYADAALNLPIGTGANITIQNMTATKTVYVEVTDVVTGCSTSDSTRVIVNTATAIPDMPSNLILCEGDFLILGTPTIANGYNWTGPNGFIATQQSPTPFAVTVLDSGTYYLSVIDSNACPSLTGTVHVSINPIPPIPSVINSSPRCTGDSIVLSASSIVGATYEWYQLPSNNVVGGGQNYSLANVSLADTGRYYVVVTLNGCTSTSASTLVTVYNNSTAAAEAGSPQNLCGVDSTSLAAIPGGANILGTWTSNSGAVIVAPNQATTLVANLSAGVHVFYWTLSNPTCPSISSDSVVITVTPQSADLANAGVDQNLCGVQTTTLAGNIPSTSTGMWTQTAAQAASGVTIVNPNNANTAVNNLVAGNSYQFVWELENGACGIHSTDTVLVTIAVAPTISAMVGNNIITCSQDTAVLTATLPSIGTGAWTTNSSAIIITPTQHNTIVTNLLQDTSMFVWTLSNGACLDYASDTMSVILGGATPIANADSFAVFANGSTITVNVLSNDLLTTNWDIYINTPMNNGQMTNLNDGKFELNLQGVSTKQRFIYELCNPACPANCDTGLVVLELLQVGDCDIPNIFTPNEDGVNDVFEVPCLGTNQVAELIVFNRWGDWVYESDNYQNQWDGTHKGEALPDGTYFYIIRIENEEPMQGSVEIRR